MSVNPSSFADITPRFFSFSNSSTSSFYKECQNSLASIIVYTAYTLSNAVLLLLYVLVLYMAFQQWRQMRRSAPARTAMSHSDFFTSNMMIMEIIGVFGSFFYTVGTFTHSEVMAKLGVYSFSILFPGQTLFHVLTCVERYLAVVHAIAYIQLREAFRVKVRNISTASAWLLSLGWVGVMELYLPRFPSIPFLPFLAICMFAIFFCCMSVLCALTRPGPGKVGGDKGRVDQSKQRAFQMIMAISVTMVLRTVGLLVCFGIDNMTGIRGMEQCWLIDLAIWLTVPSSLVLPLLFLHRAGKFSCCRKVPKSG